MLTGRGRAALALLALGAALFAKPLFLGRVLYERDIQLVWHAQTESFVRCVAAGSWPLWDPWVAFGHPMLANPNTQVLYPPHWLSLLAPAATCYAVLAAAHVFFAALGAFALARRLGLGAGGALLTGALFLTSGPLLSLVSVWHHLAGAAFVPWVLLGLERCLARPGSDTASLLGLLLGLQLLAGSPDMSLLTGLVVAALTIGSLARSASQARRARLAAAAAAALLGAGVSAGQWLPALAAALSSQRAELAPILREAWAVHPLSLFELLWPVPWSSLPINAGLRGLLYGGGRPFLHSLYLGLPALALVTSALTGASAFRRSVVVAAGALAALYALGASGPLYPALTALVPPLRALRYPSKAMVFTALAWALLAGMGFERWRGRGLAQAARRAELGPLLVATLAALGGLLLAALRPEAAAPLLLPPATLGLLPSEALRPVLGRLAVTTTLALLVLWLATRRGGSAATAVALLAVLDLGLAHRELNPTAPPDFYRYRPKALDAIRQDDRSRLFVYRYSMATDARHPGLALENPYRISGYPAGFSLDAGRALAVRLYLLPPVGAVWGLYSSYDPDLLGLYPRPLAELVAGHARSEGTAGYTRLLQLGAVRYVSAMHTLGLEALEPVATETGLLALPIRVFRVPDPLPRAYAVSGARVADGERAIRLLQDPGFDPHREVLLAEGSGRAISPGFSGTTRVLELAPDRVRLAAELSGEGYVVLVDTYDAGWRARVDGAPAEVLRANLAFRAVQLPPGRHEVELRYRPWPALLGLSMTAATLVLLTVLGGRRSLTRPDPAGPLAGAC